MAEIDLHTAAFKAIAAALRQAIRSEAVPPGLVLLEGPLAAIFKTSRSPVRQALALLSEEGVVHPFDGRGMVAGEADAPIRREPVRPEMLAIGSPTTVPPPRWRQVYNVIERDLMYASMLSPLTINESELAAYYSIGRSTANQVLNRAEITGIVGRGSMRRWSTIQLDEKRLKHLYRVRTMLEPDAMSSAAGVRTPEFGEMASRLRSALQRYPQVTADELNQLELDLHLDGIELGGNNEIVRALLHTRCILVITKHSWADAKSLPSREPFMLEHLRVVEALVRGDGPAARQAMMDHLVSAERKVLSYIEEIRNFAEKMLPPYLLRR